MVSTTPGICRNACSTPQKQPAPNVAFSISVLRSEPEVCSVRAERLDEKCDVIVEGHAELLGGLVDLVAVDVCRKAFVFQFRLHRFDADVFDALRGPDVG